ncbi:MAG: PDZ domain-containing protein [Flavobacteriales bacterium]
MLKTNLTKVLAAFIAVFSFQCAVAQSVAKITIKKNQDGVITEETRVIELSDDRDISQVLMEMGLFDELGQIKEGQEFEINLQKQDKTGTSIDLSWLNDGSNGIYESSMAPRAFLGVILRNANATDKKGKAIKGGEVTEIVEGTAAETCGLQVGDIITEIDGQNISSSDDIISIIQSKQPGDEIKITYLRDNKKKSVKAMLGERNDLPVGMREEEFELELPFDLNDYNYFFNPDSITIICPDSKNSPCDSMKICQPFSWRSEGFKTAEAPFLGVTPSEEKMEGGVKIGEIVSGSSAEAMGLLEGDIIKEINGIKIGNFDSLRTTIQSLKPHTQINVVVVRDGKSKEFKGELGTRPTSQKNDFRIFHDFKGQDENGNYTYDFELDMDAQDIEQHMEELMLMLEQQQMKLEDQQQQLQEQLDQIREGDKTTTIKFSIRIEDITPSDIAAINQSASPKVEGQDNLQLEQISFFPNPSDGQITLTFEPKEQGDAKIIIYDATGGQVYYELVSGSFGVYNNVIDLSQHSSGNYYLRILQNGKSFTRKLIIEK